MNLFFMVVSLLSSGTDREWKKGEERRMKLYSERRKKAESKTRKMNEPAPEPDWTVRKEMNETEERLMRQIEQ